MTPDQVQSIVNMKLTRQDMGTILQQHGISLGGRGTGTPGAGGGGFGGGGGPGGGGFLAVEVDLEAAGLAEAVDSVADSEAAVVQRLTLK